MTGERAELAPGLVEFVEQVRAVTDKPLAVGFGIGSPEQARSVGEIADGVIVGSALINAARAPEEPAKSVGKFVGEMRDAINQ